VSAGAHNRNDINDNIQINMAISISIIIRWIINDPKTYTLIVDIQHPIELSECIPNPYVLNNE
jgi:hypothetical protein